MSEDRVSQVCRQEVQRMQTALDLVQNRQMWTYEVRNGERVDTTADTIVRYREAITNLTPLIKTPKVHEERNALVTWSARPSW
jgi:hypothetical protein